MTLLFIASEGKGDKMCSGVSHASLDPGTSEYVGGSSQGGLHSTAQKSWSGRGSFSKHITALVPTPDPAQCRQQKARTLELKGPTRAFLAFSISQEIMSHSYQETWLVPHRGLAETKDF